MVVMMSFITAKTESICFCFRSTALTSSFHTNPMLKAPRALWRRGAELQQQQDGEHRALMQALLLVPCCSEQAAGFLQTVP